MQRSRHAAADRCAQVGPAPIDIVSRNLGARGPDVGPTFGQMSANFDRHRPTELGIGQHPAECETASSGPIRGHFRAEVRVTPRSVRVGAPSSTSSREQGPQTQNSRRGPAFVDDALATPLALGFLCRAGVCRLVAAPRLARFATDELVLARPGPLVAPSARDIGIRHPCPRRRAARMPPHERPPWGMRMLVCCLWKSPSGGVSPEWVRPTGKSRSMFLSCVRVCARGIRGGIAPDPCLATPPAVCPRRCLRLWPKCSGRGPWPRWFLGLCPVVLRVSRPLPSHGPVGDPACAHVRAHVLVVSLSVRPMRVARQGMSRARVAGIIATHHASLIAKREILEARRRDCLCVARRFAQCCVEVFRR